MIFFSFSPHAPIQVDFNVNYEKNNNCDEQFEVNKILWDDSKVDRFKNILTTETDQLIALFTNRIKNDYYTNCQKRNRKSFGAKFVKSKVKIRSNRIYHLVNFLNISRIYFRQPIILKMMMSRIIFRMKMIFKLLSIS